MNVTRSLEMLTKASSADEGRTASSEVHPSCREEIECVVGDGGGDALLSWSLDPSLVQGAETMLRQDERMESDRQACRRGSGGGGARRSSRVELDESLEPIPALLRSEKSASRKSCSSSRAQHPRPHLQLPHCGDRSVLPPTPMHNCLPFPIRKTFMFSCHF